MKLITDLYDWITPPFELPIDSPVLKLPNVWLLAKFFSRVHLKESAAAVVVFCAFYRDNDQ